MRRLRRLTSPCRRQHRAGERILRRGSIIFLMDAACTPPTGLFPELRNWQLMGMHDSVFRATGPGDRMAYVRADDGSAPLLGRLAELPDLPAPRLLDQRDGWLLLEALPVAPLHDSAWLARPGEAAVVIADALRRLERHDLRHGDMCVPNILGDLSSGHLSGIVDWRYAGRYDSEVDVASAVWSCGYNGYGPEVAKTVLRSLGRPRADAVEVRRLERLWDDLVEAEDPDPCE